MNFNKTSRRARRGFLTVDATLFVATVLCTALVLYGLAQRSIVALYQIIATHIGSPYV